MRKPDENRKRLRTASVLVGALGITLVRASSVASAAEGARAGSPPEAQPAVVAEGPPLPPSPEQEKRLAELAQRVTDAEARAAAGQEKGEGDLARERAEREGLQHRLDSMQVALDDMITALKRAERSLPAVNTARTGLTLSGFLQADFAVRQSSQDELNTSNAPLNEDRFNIRRARLRAGLEREYLAGAVEFDGNTTRGATARILGAEASVRWPAADEHGPPLLMATIGAFKIPFGYEVLQSDRDRLFLERSTAERGLFPGEYDLGFRLQGGWRFVRYALAFMNGEPAGETTGFPGRDPNHQKDVVGRVGVDVDIVETISLAAGVSGLTGSGFHAGTPATKPQVIWQDRNEDGMYQPSEVSVAAGVAASPSATFRRQAIGADVRLALRLLPIGETVGYGEVYLAKNLDRAILPADPKATGRDITEVGSYVGLTQELGPHAMAGFRYDYYNPDKDSTDTQRAILIPQTFIYQTFSFAAALVHASGRLIVEYDVNRNHQGRDAQGVPTNLKDNAFFVRGEAKF